MKSISVADLTKSSTRRRMKIYRYFPYSEKKINGSRSVWEGCSQKPRNIQEKPYVKIADVSKSPQKWNSRLFNVKSKFQIFGRDGRKYTKTFKI